MLLSYLYEHQKKAIEEQNKYKKCLINMWCGTGKTRTFTINLFIINEKMNVIVFPSLGLINQYCNDYVLSTEEPFKSEFEKYKCLAFCSDDDGKLKLKGKIKFTTNENKLHEFLKKKNKQIILVTYQSFEKFINICIDKNININNLIFDESHHVVGNKIQNIVFNNEELDAIVDKTRYYTATPVNNNGISMYDRYEPENSDCGPLAYEYLYYKAVEDGICKSFETQINLYTQKPEYKNKYQPVFESIIRACLSGKYNYWNILTYHLFVNENEDISDNISCVKEFASAKNQRLVKKLFTRIQNEEFPHTKELYSVENVILKGVHSKTPTRQQIIKDFNRKVEGRIYILSSCGILNEGIDTKWANMGVPINPTKSIVKEPQRIGRLVRIPEEGMPPAILLIPCEVDITKYSSMNTSELRDQMIREELSECGNFNTALNVISAFKYQYDPELFEMCLNYPNMYAPKEVKDNLAKQGLIVGDSQGNLLNNLKYVCEKEDIKLDTESFKDGKNKEILKEIAEQCEKTIEIHTQNHDEPIKYINEEASDKEPLRLFYCEDDKTYAPITKKEQKHKIKKKSTTPPEKRNSLFNIHTHPDLELLWKIKEDSIDLVKGFSKGILDVDVSWNEKKWEENLERVSKYIDENKKLPSTYDKDSEIKYLGKWLSHQKINYTKKIKIMKQPEIQKEWETFIDKYSEYFIDNNIKWKTRLQQVSKYIDENKKLPSTHDKDSEIKYLGQWLSHQKNNYTKKTQIMNDVKIQKEWETFIDKYSEYFIDNNTKWKTRLQQVSKYIDENKKLPSINDKNPEIKKLGIWLGTQKINYTKKIKIIKQPEIQKEWETFIDKYSEYFIDNNTKWKTRLQQVSKYIDENKKLPSEYDKNTEIKKLGKWLAHQRYTKKTYIMNDVKIQKEWETFIDKYSEYFIDNNTKWKTRLQQVSKYIDENKKLPSTHDKDSEIKYLGRWLGTQKKNYTKKTQIMKQPEIYDTWTVFINDSKYNEYLTNRVKNKSMAKPKIVKKEKSETPIQRKERVESEISILNQKYKTMNSHNLHKHFEEHPDDWEEYHKISKTNEESFPYDEIPRNKMINYLENLPGKKQKVIADLGCGFAEINQHFKDNNRFTFHNFDHHSPNEFVTKRDIQNTGLEGHSIDIAILSLAMWGSNCEHYLKEVHRILDTGGILLIGEAYKRWNKELDDDGNPINRLVKILEENNFVIVENQEEKFMFIECRKQ